jgi:hypothetical protein
MTDPTPDAIPQAVFGALNASGFPFQTAIENLVRLQEGWAVAAAEFPWQDPDAGDLFLDLVATRGPIAVTVECKKTQKETLTFLQPTGAGPQGDVDQARLLYAEQIDDSTRRLERFCGWWGIGTPCAQAGYCVVSTSSGGKDGRLLERDAQRLVRATDAYALRPVESFQPTSFGENRRPFVPAIVTNAPLYLARYDPAAIDLETGEFDQQPAGLTSIPWVRFTKSFTSAGGTDLGERTVFVVGARSLPSFLQGLLGLPRQPTSGQGRILPRPQRR